MVPLSKYATVPKDATLRDAVIALKMMQEELDKNKYPHRAVLVLDDKNHVVGKVDLLCFLKALEPKYDEMLTGERSIHLGFTLKFQKIMLEQLKLWNDPMERICERGAKITVSLFMNKLTEGEYIEADATLDKAIHQLVLECKQSLLVTQNRNVIGILRLADVFDEISNAVVACNI